MVESAKYIMVEIGKYTLISIISGLILFLLFVGLIYEKSEQDANMMNEYNITEEHQ